MGRRKKIPVESETDRAMLGNRYKCAYCGKAFHIPWHNVEEWGWAVGSRACCSYTCMRALDRLLDEIELEKKRSSRSFRMYEDWAAGMSCLELQEKYQEQYGNIYTRLLLLEARHPRITWRIRQEKGAVKRAADDTGRCGGGAEETSRRSGDGGSGEP